ncbi:MAG: NADPH:quinone oxidoreductase family protein, partial [Sphingomonadales bacterium]
MRALLCKEPGPAAKLVIEDVPDPEAGRGEVVIDVMAAGLNFPDLLIIEGKYQLKPPLPFSPGAEVAGVVSEIGEGVSGIKPGDRVSATMFFGGFAEKVAVPANQVSRLADTMPFEVGAAFTIAYGTSYHALKQRAELREGETLLVLGASGGVGLAAVELGRAMGARVIAAASSPEKLETAKQHGAVETINYSEENLKARAKALSGGRGVDVIYDPVGGDYSEAALRAIAVGGRHLVIGFAAGDIPKLPLNLTLLKQCQIVGVFWGAWAMANPAEQAKNMAELNAFFEAGDIKPLISEALP